MSAPRQTVLFAEHRKLGAKMTGFGGFEMPLQYSGIIDEHRTVRSAAGIFDLSHMGEFYCEGPRALSMLERLLTNSAARLREGQAQYTLLCADHGGVIDDLIVYRLGQERYLLCVNASNIENDREWITSHNDERAEFHDASDETALIAVQGPRAITILKRMAPFQIDQVRRFGVAEGEVAGCRCIAARTGYTGEDGFELFVANPKAERLFGAILDEGARDGLKPIGLGARDTLRLEAGLPLYGHELDRLTSPLEAGLSAYVRLGREFIGAGELERQHANGISKRLIGLMTDDRRTIARQDYRVLTGGRQCGTITSGTYGPSLDRPIAMAFVEPAVAGEPAAPLEVEVRNRAVAVTITPLPFYKRSRK